MKSYCVYMTAYFTPDTFKFLRALKKNNDRDWFQKNKPRYEEAVKNPMLHFITDLRPRLKEVSSHFKVDPKPVGGSMFRIYRDIRFSADKSPYKTHASAHFPHRSSGKDVHTPGFYFHLENGECFSAAGIWRPDSVTLSRIRNAILDEPEKWEQMLAKKIPPLEGDSLKKNPRGFDPGHPFIEDLKRKDFICSVSFTEKQICSRDFMDRYIVSCKKMSPLMEFLTEVLRLQW